MNLRTIIDAAASADPQRTALIIDGQAIGYGTLDAAVRRCAAGLAAAGVTSGDRVAIVDTASLLSIASLLGAARIGATAALMNPALTPAELRALLDNAGCCPVAVAGEAFAHRLPGSATALTATELLNQDAPERSENSAGDVDRPAMVLQRHNRVA